MADFRKLFYALAVVALLAAVTVPASAQGLTCGQPAGVNAAIRQGGVTEFVGDMVVTCTSEIPGVSTPAGIAVKQGTLRLTVSGTTFTTKHWTSGNFNMSEALLLIDNPSPVPPANPQYVCGQNSTDNGPAGAGVCSILSTGNPDQTYDGTAGSGYNTGRPNIYQARWVNNTTIDFVGVPLDPPGTNKVRIFRFKNSRVDASNLALGAQVQLALTVVNSDTSMALPLVNTALVATVVPSAPITSFSANNYTVCVPVRGAGGTVTITEGSDSLTASTWRARNTNQHILNAANYALNQFVYGGTTTVNSTDAPQTYPLGGYFTESNFQFANPGMPNGLDAAGSANTGTRLTFPISPALTGVSYSWPSTVQLQNVNTNAVTGFLFLVTDPTYTNSTQITYEVGFANPFTNEYASITPTISYSPTITGPQSFGAGSAILEPLNTIAPTNYPRFVGQLGPATNNNLVVIGTCKCNLLFPWIVSNSGYATGIAVSNTTLDPVNAGITGATGFVGPTLQTGVVRLYLFGTNSAGTSTTAALSQTSAPVPSGQSTSFLISGVSGGFQGYAIAQADFQYCHGVAYVAPTSGLATLSYLGLVMDKSFFNLPRTTAFSTDSMDH